MRNKIELKTLGKTPGVTLIARNLRAQKQKTKLGNN
jgi:hypothetical protein